MDFLRLPVTDPETGEVLDAHPSCYESVAGGLPDIRRCPQHRHTMLMQLTCSFQSHLCMCGSHCTS